MIDSADVAQIIFGLSNKCTAYVRNPKGFRGNGVYRAMARSEISPVHQKIQIKNFQHFGKKNLFLKLR